MGCHGYDLYDMDDRLQWLEAFCKYDHVLGPSLGNADSKDTVMHYWQNAGFPKL